MPPRAAASRCGSASTCLRAGLKRCQRCADMRDAGKSLAEDQNLHEVADADLLLSQQVEQPEARRITESLKELWEIEPFVGHA